jgi:hypothetical protein
MRRCRLYRNLCALVSILLVASEVEHRVSCLLDRHSTTWALMPALFALIIFEVRACIMSYNSLIYVSTHIWVTGIGHLTQLLVEMGVSGAFCLGWPWITIILISASWVAEITELSPLTWSNLGFYSKGIGSHWRKMAIQLASLPKKLAAL